jgi:hypothetical protein
MGYSLAPLCVGLLIAAVLTSVWSWYGVVILVVGTMWGMWGKMQAAGVRFLLEAAEPGKRLLLTYPVVVFYLALGWFTFLVEVL